MPASGVFEKWMDDCRRRSEEKLVVGIGGETCVWSVSCGAVRCNAVRLVVVQQRGRVG